MLDSDILILIVGWRYGQVYENLRSLTEIEWRTAEENEKQVIFLLLDGPPPTDVPPVVTRACANVPSAAR